MMKAHRILLITSACLAMLVPALGTAAEAADGDAYDQAVAQYQHGRWADAYGRFLALANEGDADAARTALFMYRYGPQLYKTHWDASPREVQQWERLAATSQGRGSPVFQPMASR